VATVALLCGFGLPLCSWLFFRQPGVSVWAESAPLWRAGEYLTPTGVVLWLAGFPAVTLGAILVLLATRSMPVGDLRDADTNGIPADLSGHVVEATPPEKV
jgi:hypothetical protein